MKIDQQLLFRYFEGATSVEEEQWIREWLQQDAKNQLSFLSTRKLFDAVLLQSDEASIVIKQRRSLSPWIGELVKIAAVAALAFMISYLFFHQPDKDDLLTQTLYVPEGQRMNVTLPDGTNVWLNANTQLTYPLSFNKKKRHVELEGEAYFDVTKDDKKPFIVQTKQYAIEVLGTEFNVDAYSNGGSFETMLKKGSVVVSSLLHPEERVQLTPAHKAMVQEGRLIVEQVSDYCQYEWRDGFISFKQKSFFSIMHDFEKQFDLKIVIENDRCKEHLYTGKFRVSDGLDYALRVLQNDIPFTYQRDDDKRTISIK